MIPDIRNKASKVKHLFCVVVVIKSYPDLIPINWKYPKIESVCSGSNWIGWISKSEPFFDPLWILIPRPEFSNEFA